MRTLRELQRRARSAASRARIRGCDSIGELADVTGTPFVSNQGRITVGRCFEMSAVPVRSHLVTEASGSVVIGDNVRIAYGVGIFSAAEILIGDDTTIGPLAMLLDVDFHDIYDQDARGEPRPIHIGRGVHLGSGVVVLRGAVIGDGVRVAPNSVVSRFLPAGSHAAGVPARPVNA
jgi:maltose O-acetyltransferase